jgi:hypothetical protein
MKVYLIKKQQDPTCLIDVQSNEGLHHWFRIIKN